jgi:hypothetical protein
MKVILFYWQVTAISGDSGTPEPLMESWSGLPAEGASAHSSDGGGAMVDARDRGIRSPDSYDDFERQTREGVRVLDEMSDEEDGRVIDEPGEAREPHKDVPTVSLESPVPHLEKKLEKKT